MSKVTLSIDDSKVNYSKSGIYTANVIAKDESGNETRKDIKIVVEEKKKILDLLLSLLNQIIQVKVHLVRIRVNQIQVVHRVQNQINLIHKKMVRN